MFNKVWSKHLLFGLGVLLIIILAFAAFVVFKAQSPVLAQDEPPVEILDSTIQASVWRTTPCHIADIAIFPDRIHVRCTTASPTGVLYFAAASDSANSLMTNRYLMMLNTGFSLAKPVDIQYENLTSANPPGCLTGDCRKIVGMKILP